MGTIALDGTKLKANASYSKTKTMAYLNEDMAAIDKQIDAIIKECEETDKNEDELMGENESPKRHGKPDIRIYKCADCPGCKRKPECTKAERRTVAMDPREFLMRKMRARLDKPQGKRKYGKRKCLVEPVFGDLKHNRNMRGLLLRGKLKAGGEFLLMCISHNLRKIAGYIRPEKLSPQPMGA